MIKWLKYLKVPFLKLRSLISAVFDISEGSDIVYRGDGCFYTSKLRVFYIIKEPIYIFDFLCERRWKSNNL